MSWDAKVESTAVSDRDGRDTLHALFETQATATPDVVAAVYGRQYLTYRMLNERAHRLAQVLAGRGACPEASVGIFLGRSLDVLVAMLGVLKAGAAYLPLDPQYPGQRIRSIVDDAAPACVITTAALASRIDRDVPVVMLDDPCLLASLDGPTADAAAFESVGSRISRGVARHSAYVIYTSGSSGTPKGVSIEHRSVVAFVKWALDAFESGELEKVLASTSICFDLSIFEIYAPLCCGGTVLLTRSITEVTPEELENATLVNTVPSAMKALVDGHGSWDSVQVVNLAGEVIHPSLVADMYRKSPGVRILNLYGPTEDTTYSTCESVSKDAAAGGRIPIGRPIGNTEVRVLDARLDAVPKGTQGELYIAGYGLARGYLNRPGLTAERFVADPDGRPGTRMYRTGDVARWREDGSLDFLGRVDQQVKLRGFRIELGEIESVLRERDDVSEAVVALHEERPQVEELVAYVVPVDGVPLDSETVRADLGRRVPVQMVPARLVQLERLPRTPNGKVDRKALPAPTRSSGAPYRPPRKPEEEILCALFAEALGVDRVGLDDDFFDLGGHSLAAMSVVSRVSATLGLDASVDILFETRTVRALSPRLRESQLQPTEPPVPQERPARLPLSYAQQGIWLVERRDGPSARYNMPEALRLRGVLDVDALRQTVNAIVARHESLRTHFTEIDGEPMQVIETRRQIPVPVDNLQDLSGPAQVEAVVEAMQHEAEKPFDLARGPLLRLRILRLGSGEHVLVRTIHHIVSDGWSQHIINREFMELYEATKVGRASRLQPLQVQYADFALWQRHWLDRGELARGLAHWNRELNGIPERLTLPTDRPRPAIQSFRANRHEKRLPEGKVAALKRLGREERATLYMVLLTAYGVLLARYSGQKDIVVGSPTANRPEIRLEEMIGLFVNALVMRMQVAPRMTFRGLLAKVRSTALAAYAHQSVPFERLVEELAPPRRVNVAPIFQASFALQTKQNLLRLAGLQVEPLSGIEPRVRLDLELYAEEHEGAVVFSWVYNRSLFDPERMERMAEHYVRIIEAMVANPDRMIGQMELLTATEEAQVVGAWNATTRPVPVATVAELFEAQAGRTPDRLAVVFEDEALTYRALDGLTAALAQRLIAVGAKTERVVGIALERSMDMVVAVMAVLKTGAAYVALDLNYPADRIAFIVDEAEPCAVVTNTSGRRGIPDGVVVVDMEEWRSELENGEVIVSSGGRLADAERRRRRWGGHPAYVMYTSGSTGGPKGVSVLHQALSNHMHWIQSVLALGGEDRLLLKTAFTFDASVWEFLAPLLAGAALQIAPVGVEREPRLMLDCVRMHGVTVVQVVPSFLFQLAKEPKLASCLALKHVLCGGEALGAELRDHFGRSSKAILHNLYGPTETTIDATWMRCQNMTDGDVAPIGGPVWNTRVRVLDTGLRLAPVGVTGELYIAGTALARGYFERPRMTAERFVADPYGEAGDRMYRTGDLVRWRKDGVLEFLGRMDLQVKIRGHRVELREIEAVLLRQTEVAQAVVSLCKDHTGESTLVGYVVARADHRTDFGKLRRRLGEQLPEYMVPAQIMVLDAFPLTSHGKVDRQSLPAPRRDARAPYSAPRTPEEEILCGLFGEVLGMARVGLDDDFFELGGHSLMGISLLSRVREALGAELWLDTLFQATNVRNLALELRRPSEHRVPLVAQTRPERLPLSYAQQRLWFLNQLEGTGGEYNVPAMFDVRGEVDVSGLTRAVNAVVARHESLRTHFSEVEGEPVQVVEARREVPVAVEDLRGAGETAVAAAIRREVSAPFDLSTGPVLRVRLLRVGDAAHVLLCTTHHIASDGWSQGVFNRELGEAYEAAVAGRALRLAPLAVQYADFTLWQRAWLEAGALTEGLAYWTEQLAGVPERLALPTDRPRPPVQTFEAEEYRMTLPASTTSALRRVSQESQATLYMTLLAGFGVVLARHSGQEDIVVGSPVANRQDLHLEGLIGFFVNSLVLRLRVEPTLSFRGLLASVRQTALAAYQHQDVPFERLVEALAPPRSVNTPPVFQVSFAVQNAPREALRLSGLTVEPVAGAPRTVRFDLEVHVWEEGDALEVAWLYNRALFDAWRVAQLAQHYGRVLAAVSASPEQAVGEVALLTAAERAQVLERWNHSQYSHPTETVPGLFEACAARTPRAPAVVAEGESLTYDALNVLGNRVAHYLIANCVAPEDVVAVVLPRSPQAIATILGVLKAGAVYLPIDLELPAERLRRTLADAQARLVITIGARVDAFAKCGYDAIAIDSTADLQGLGSAARNPPAMVKSANSAYINYTSGSTGTPKGILVPHGGVVRLVQDSNFATLDNTTRFLHLAPLSFDASTLEIWGPLLNGGVVVVMPAGLASTDEIGRRIVDAEVNAIWLTSMLFKDMVKYALPALVSVRQLFAGGDVVSPNEVDTLRKAHADCQFINGYGPTENTTFTCCYPVPADEVLCNGVPIGFPVSRTHVYVLDESLEPIPVGVAGELYAGGAGLARGYLKQVALTAERFVADPFGAAGTRMYRTGDVVRWRPDGTLEFLGRSDHQVKVRGFRVELGEIEATLQEQAGVAQAVVVTSDDCEVGKRLIAYLVASQKTPVDLPGMRQSLRRRLPEYMVPTQMIVLDALPRTSNGKLDRAALAARDVMPNPVDWRAPRMPKEEMLCGLFAEVLGVARVGLDDDFFALGGHSLMATRLVSRIRSTMEVDLSIRTLFEAPTVGRLTERLRDETDSRVPFVPQTRPSRIPLSYAQQRLWFLNRAKGTSAEYNVAEALRLRGELDVRAVGDAVNAIVVRHESLRTHFAEVEGEPVQVVEPSRRIAVPIEDLSCVAAAERAAAVRVAMRREVATPFNLVKGPVLRMRLLRIAENDHVLLRTMHHIVSDAWSQGVFNQEFMEAYEAARVGRPLQLAPLAVQYADFTLWQRQWLDVGAMRQGLAYWTQQLAELPEQLMLPTDRPRPSVLTFEGDVCRLSLPESEVAALRRVSREARATLYMTMLAGFGVLLARHSGQEDIVVGSPIANRQHERLEPMIGFFVNLLVLRLRVRPTASFRTLLEDVRQTALAAYQHQDVPFERIVQALAPERRPDRTPIFQVSFGFHNAPWESQRMHGLEVEAMRGNELWVRYDLEIHAFEVGDGEMSVLWAYRTDLFDQWRVEQMTRHYRRLLAAVATDPDQPIHGLDLLDAEERRNILRGFNAD